MLFTSHYAQFVDGNGDPLSGGVVKFFEPGTSTPKDVYSDGDLTTSIGSEVTLDSSGQAVIFLDGNYKVTLEDSGGSVIKTVDDINVPDTGGKTEITNPSFETAGASATDIPGWDRSAPSGVTVERVTTDNYHGAACLEITSDGSNAGYGETADFVSVSPGREYEVSFALESSSATVTNTVQVRWFDESQNLVSTSTVYNASSGNPTSFENKVFTATPPATARYAKIRAQLGATAGTTRFDDFELRVPLQGGAIRSNTKANLSAGITDSFAYATDENRGYYDDGSALNPAFGDFERVLARVDTDQTIPNNALTTVEFEFEVYDTGDMWADSSPTEIVCPRDGVIVATAQVNWSSNSTGYRYVVIEKNGLGGFDSPEDRRDANVASEQNLSSPPMEVSADDKISIDVQQTSGGDLDIDSAFLSVYYIG